jgi:hypothetical protein
MAAEPAAEAAQEQDDREYHEDGADGHVPSLLWRAPGEGYGEAWAAAVRTAIDPELAAGASGTRSQERIAGSGKASLDPDQPCRMSDIVRIPLVLAVRKQLQPVLPTKVRVRRPQRRVEEQCRMADVRILCEIRLFQTNRFLSSAIRHSGEASASCVERRCHLVGAMQSFIHRKNLELLRKHIAETSSDERRLLLEKLLSEEEPNEPSTTDKPEDD